MSGFRDEGIRLHEFDEYRIVKCPKCSKPTDYFGNRLSCGNCGFIDGSDQYYELFLKTDCCNEVLWALNPEHLDFMENYVSALLRTREPNINKSLVSRLPQWIKSRKNREQILKCIHKLRERLKEEGYKRRMLE